MESRKKNGSPYWFAFVLSLILLGCTGKDVNQTYNGTYSTEKVRAMWHVCYLTHKKTQPEAPEPYHWALCDCVVDEGRKTYGAEDYEKHDQLEVTEFFRKAVLSCSMKLKGMDGEDLPQMRTM